MIAIFPYRWLPRTIFSNIYYLLRNIYKGVYNVFRWIPIIWRDEDWDWGYLAKIMEYKTRRMSKCLGNGYHKTSKRDAKWLLICSILLKRMIADEYGNYKMAIKDQEYLGKIISKHLMEWWD